MERIIIWAVILAVSVVVECCTTALVSIWFAPSAAVCVLLELLGIKNIYIQLAVFILLTALLVFLLRNKIRESFKSPSAKTNVDSLIDKTAVVEETILDGKPGRVKVGGMSWAAVSEESRPILSGEKVKIIGVSGVKLCCKPISDELPRPSAELIGKQAKVETKIDNFEASGIVICEGKAYLAKSLCNEIIYENAVIRITSVDGDRVVCEKLTAEAAV